jgi:hypothetical protein
VSQPVGIGRVLVGTHDDTGIAAEQVDAAELGRHLGHQLLQLGLDANIQCACPRTFTDARGHLPRSIAVQVGDDDGARTRGGETLAQRPADAGAATGDDDDLVLDLHERVSPRLSCSPQYRSGRQPVDNAAR